MYKGNCLNPQISKIFSETGHTDLFAVVDAGFPIPKDTERVDLIWRKGQPSWLDICGLIKDNMVIEKIYLAEEIKEINPEMKEEFEKLFYGIPIEYIKHTDLKITSKTCRAIIRTGEFIPYCNCIFVAGVNF